MIIAQILSPWIGNGTPVSNPKRPQFFDDYPAITANDVTGQTSAPPPGVLVIEAWMTPEQYAIVEADAAYQILTSQEVETP